MSEVEPGYSVQAHEALLNGNYTTALKLYRLAEMETGKGVFDTNIDICLAALDRGPEERHGLGEGFCLDTVNASEAICEEADELACEASPLLLLSGSSLDRILQFGVIDRFRRVAPHGKVCIVLRGASVSKGLSGAEQTGADSVFVAPFETEDEFWINFALNHLEFSRVLGVNFSRIDSAASLFSLEVEKGAGRTRLGVCPSGIAMFSLGSHQVREQGGFFVPMDPRASCLNYLLRLEWEGKITGRVSGRVLEILDTGFQSHTLPILRKITFDLCEKQKSSFVKPLSVMPWLESQPAELLGKASVLLTFYNPDRTVSQPVDVHCFESYLRRAGIEKKIKNEEFFFLDRLERPRFKVLSNTSSGSELRPDDALRLNEDEKLLHYADLLPLSTYPLNSIEPMVAEGRTPISVQVPVIRSVACGLSRGELDKIATKERFGSVSACFDNQSTVVGAVLSVLAQSVTQLEVNVVDDGSSDRGFELISQLLPLFPYAGSHLSCNSQNLGVYPSRNAAIINARANYLFGQDLDDFSTPQRVFLSNVLLRDSEKDFLVTRHSRYDSGANLLSMRKDSQPLQLFRKGLMTWHTRRSTFFDFGLFSHVRRSGDSELYDRIKRFGRGVIDAPLDTYLALMDDANQGRLTSDMFKAGQDRSPLVYHFAISPDRVEYEKRYKAVHQSMHRPVNRFGGNVINPDEYKKVVGSVATIPGREHQLAQMLNSILKQVDALNVFLNGAVDTNQPDLSAFLNDERVKVYRSQEVGDFRDNVKFFLASQREKDSYYFTFDDDLIYPQDYVDTFLYKSFLYNDKKVLCVHGYRLWNNVSSIHTDREKRGRYYHFREPLENDILVDIPGTGTAMVPPEAPIASFNRPPYGMIDVVFADFCAKKAVDVVALARPIRWVREAPVDHSVEQGPPSLFRQNQVDSREREILGFVQSIQENRPVRAGSEIRNVQAYHAPVSARRMAFSRRYDADYCQKLGRKVYLCCTGYNGEDHAFKFIRSVFWALRNTNYSDVELLIYDDCSTDNSVNIFHDFVEKSITAWPVRIFQGGRNLGPAFGRAFLAEQIKEEDAICIFLDSDDEISPNLLRRIIAEYVAYPDALGTYGSWMFNDTIKRAWPSHTMQELRGDPIAHNVFKFGQPRSLVKKVISGADQRFMFTPEGEWLKYCSDLGLYLSVMAKSDISRFHRINDILYFYNVGTDNGTIVRFGNHKKIMRDYLFYLYREVMFNGNTSLPNPYPYRAQSDFRLVKQVYSAGH